MKFKDISLLDFLNSDDNFFKYEKEILRKYNIVNVEQLINMMDKGHSDFNQKIFKRIREQAENLISKSQNAGFKKDIFVINNDYDNDLKRVMFSADKTTLAQDLVLFPLLSNDYLKIILRRYRVDQIKFLISHYNLRGKNALVASLDGMGYTKLPKMIKALEFYNDQIERLYKENITHNGVNLFYLNMTTKLEMVREEMDVILEYLFSLTKDYIWGSVSDKEKLNILEALKRGNICKDKRLINLADIISNYVTLGELEQGITRKRTLDRFKKE